MSGLTKKLPSNVKPSSSREEMNLKSCYTEYLNTDKPAIQSDSISDYTILHHNIRSFHKHLDSLNSVFLMKDAQSCENLRQIAHEHLGNVLQILKEILNSHPDLKSNLLIAAAFKLIVEIRSLSNDIDEDKLNIFTDYCDNLASSFSTNVSNYIHKELDDFRENRVKENDLLLTDDSFEISNEEVSGREIDEMMDKVKNGADECFNRFKTWSKYVKHLIKYVEQRALFEMEFAKNIKKLADVYSTKLKNDENLPLQTNYLLSLKQDCSFAKEIEENCRNIREHVFVSSMTLCLKKQEESCKIYYDLYRKSLKKSKDAFERMESVKANKDRSYSEMERLKQTLSSISDQDDPRAREKVEKNLSFSQSKLAEIEVILKDAIKEANNQHVQNYATQKSVITGFRKLINEGDSELCKQSAILFQTRKNVAKYCVPNLTQNEENCRQYVVGSHFADFAKKLFKDGEKKHDFIPEPYSFQNCCENSFRRDDLHLKAKKNISDTESISGSSSKSRESSPIGGSPCVKKVFGVSLNNFTNRVGCLIPSIVNACIEFLETNDNLSKEGIYRVSASKVREDNLREFFESHENVTFKDIPEDFGGKEVAGVLKRYFRTLPDPLLTFKLYDDFIELSQKFPDPISVESTNESLILELTDLVQRLPKAHYMVLEKLLMHLYKVSMDLGNNMNAFNLSVVFGPNLLRDRRKDDYEDQNELLNQSRLNKVIEILINFAAIVFKENTPNTEIYNPLSSEVDTYIDSTSQDDS